MSLRKIFVIYFLFNFSIYSQDKFEHFSVLGDRLLSESMTAKSSSTLFEKEDLDQLPNAYLQDIVEFTPGMTFTGGSAKGRFFQIRGIGERSSYEGMPNYSVALVLDDIDYSGMGDIMNLSDIDSVSILRGPQLTVQGPNGIGGLITLKTKEFSSETNVQASFGYGSFNTKNISASVTGPITERISYRISSQLLSSDGYIKNTYVEDEDTNYSNDRSVKAGLSYQDSKWDIKFNLHHFKFDEGYDYFNQSNSRTSFSDNPGDDRNEVNAQSLKIERDFGSILSTTTLTYLKSHSEYQYDEDWGNNEYWNNVEGYNKDYDYRIRFPKERERISLDQRFYFQKNNLNSHVGFYLRKDEETSTEQGFKNEVERKNISSKLGIDQIALYGQVRVELSTHSEFVLGARLENRESTYSNSIDVSANPSDLLWGAEFSYVYRPNTNIKTYLKVARAFKGGGVNTQSNVGEDRKQFNDEQLYLIEAALDYAYSRGSYVKASVYSMYRDEVQVKTSFQDDPLDPSSYTFYQDNASSAKVSGLELEGRQILFGDFSIKYGVSLMNSSYGDYEYGSRNLRGRELAYSPEYQMNISLDYTNSNGFFGSLRGSMQDNIFFANSNDQKSKTNQLLHLNVGKQFQWGEVRLWSQNILNETTQLRGFYFSNEPPEWKKQRYVQLGPPRTFGFEASVNF